MTLYLPKPQHYQFIDNLNSFIRNQFETCTGKSGKLFLKTFGLMLIITRVHMLPTKEYSNTQKVVHI